MVYDTDIFIWIQRGNSKAAKLITKDDDKYLSVQSYMELLQCAQNKNQQVVTQKFIHDFNFMVLPLTESIGHRALLYVEEYGLSSSMRSGDAIIAATAIENDMVLVSSNYKHFKTIQQLQFQPFRP